MEGVRKSIQTETNYGIELVRMLMCFVVVLCHFWNGNTNSVLLKPFLWLRPLTVPVFMMVSFLLVGKSFFHNPEKKIKKRLLRLGLPLIIWAIVYWIVYYALDISNSICDLIFQIFTGHCKVLNPSMWFQTVMIAITVLFFLVFYLLDSRLGVMVAIILGVASLLFQYSGLNKALFGGMRFELSYPIGRFFEMIPYASLGLCFAYYRVYERFEKYRWQLIIGSTVVFCLLIFKPLPLNAPGYDYSGINNLLKGLAIVNIAYLLPLHRLSKSLLKVIEILTRYTLGIYCIHRLIAQVFSTIGIAGLLNSVLDVSDSSFAMCVVIYMGSYLCSALISLIPSKYARQLVE